MAAPAEAMAVTLKADFRDFEKQLLKAQNATDAKLTQIERKFAKTNRQVKDDTRGLGGALGDLQRQVGGALPGLPALGGGFNLVGIAGAAAAGGVLALVSSLRGLEDAAKFAADLTDSADRIGVTVEALQELRYVADESGVPLNELEKGLEALNASLGAFKTGIGAGRITPIFEALGLTRADLESVENAQDLLPILADRLGQVSSRAEQVQLARKLGIEPLLPLLRQGSDDIRRLADEGRNLGLVLSEDVVKRLDETDRALEKNRQQIDANVREMKASLAPFWEWVTRMAARAASAIADIIDQSRRIEDQDLRRLEQRRDRAARRVAENRRRNGGQLDAIGRAQEHNLGLYQQEILARRRAQAPAPRAAERAGFDLDIPDTPRGGSGRGSAPRAPSGPSPEELARQRELLRMQGELEVLRAQGDDKAARRLQQELDTRELTQRYQAAGVENAEAEARAHVQAVATAQEAAQRRQAMNERARQDAEAAAELIRRENREAVSRLQTQLELARLSGDPARITALERELFIAQRVNELLEARPELITKIGYEAAKAAASAQAGSEAADIDAAMGEGRQRDAARAAARDFVDIIASEDWADAAGRRFREAAFDGLEDLLAQIFNGLGKGDGNGNWLSALGSAIFGGFRANGGPVSAGRAYVVGEKRPEVFVPRTAGTIIPSVNAAMAGAQGGGKQVVQVFQVNAQGAILSDQLMSEMQAYANRAASQAGVQAVGVMHRSFSKVARQERQRFVKLGT